MWPTINDLPIHPSWKPILEPLEQEIATLGEFLEAEEKAGRGFLPAQDDVFRAMSYPFEEVKVLIMGQDPYPTPGHAMGLSFSTQPGVRPLPRSLTNIFKELSADIGAQDAGAPGSAPGSAIKATQEKPPAAGQMGLNIDLGAKAPVELPQDGDLTAWSRQGVALFNRVLTVSPGAPASHKGKGWEKITETAITALANRNQPLVAILWGKQAQDVQRFLGNTPCICSAHPSPLSASRGFLGSRPFSQTNEILKSLGATEVDWRL